MANCRNNSRAEEITEITNILKLILGLEENDEVDVNDWLENEENEDV